MQDITSSGAVTVNVSISEQNQQSIIIIHLAVCVNDGQLS